MPTYEYRCSTCDTVVEIVHAMLDESTRQCERCDSELTKLFSIPKIQYKGSGWAWQEKIPQTTEIVLGAGDEKKA